MDYGKEEGVFRRCTFLASTKLLTSYECKICAWPEKDRICTFLASTKLLTSYVCKICASHSKKVQPEKEAASTRLYRNTQTRF